MAKRLKRISAILIALALVCVSFATLSFAEEPDRITEAAITKILQFPENTVYPAVEFEFTVTPVSFNGATSGAGFNAMPAIGDAGLVTIAFDGTEITNEAYPFPITVSAGGTVSIPKESEELFGNVDWPSAGVYVYTIAETDSDFVATNDGTVSDMLVMSQAVYTLTIIVKEDGESHELFIYHIGDVRTTTDGGTPADYKVDPTPGTTSSVYDYSQMTFINRYVKHFRGSTPETAPLAVTKVVTGDGDPDEWFKFTITINSPELASLVPGVMTGNWQMQYVNSAGQALNRSELMGMDYPDFDVFAGGGGSFYVPDGEEVTFYLKHGVNVMSLGDLPVGSTWVVTEIDPIGYIPSVNVTVQIDYEEDVILIDGDMDTSLSTGEQLIADLEVTNSRADYENYGYNDTGLNLNILPFYGMIVLAVVALGVFLAAMARKRKAQQF